MSNSTSKFLSVALSDLGRVRKNNEDSILSLPEHGFCCVADGMGGGENGEVASSMVVNALRDLFKNIETDIGFDSKVELIKNTIFNVNKDILDYANNLGSKVKVGTTIVAYLLNEKDPTNSVAIHAGDSRLYRLRDKTLKQITVDHSVIQERGLKENNAPAIFRGVITRALGIVESLNLEITEFDVLQDDILILCSDGLTGMVSDRSLKYFLLRSKERSLFDRTRLLIAMANMGGGKDNISVILGCFDNNQTLDGTGEPKSEEKIVSSDFENDSSQEDTSRTSNISMEEIDFLKKCLNVKESLASRIIDTTKNIRYAIIYLISILLILVVTVLALVNISNNNNNIPLPPTVHSSADEIKDDLLVLLGEKIDLDRELSVSFVWHKKFIQQYYSEEKIALMSEKLLEMKCSRSTVNAFQQSAAKMFNDNQQYVKDNISGSFENYEYFLSVLERMQKNYGNVIEQILICINEINIDSFAFFNGYVSDELGITEHLYGQRNVLESFSNFIE